MRTETFECWTLIDNAGDYATGTTREQAIEHYENECQPLADAECVRFVCTNITVALPKVVEIEVEVPEAEEEEAVVSVS